MRRRVNGIGELEPCSDIDDPDVVPCLCPSGMMLDTFTHQCVPVGQPSVRTPVQKKVAPAATGSKTFAAMPVLGGVAIGAAVFYWVARQRGLVR